MAVSSVAVGSYVELVLEATYLGWLKLVVYSTYVITNRRTIELIYCTTSCSRDRGQVQRLTLTSPEPIMTPINMDLWHLFPSSGASTHGPTLPSTLQPLLILLVFGIIYQNNLLLTTSKIQMRWWDINIMLNAVGFLQWGYCGALWALWGLRTFWEIFCVQKTQNPNFSCYCNQIYTPYILLPY